MHIRNFNCNVCGHDTCDNSVASAHQHPPRAPTLSHQQSASPSRAMATEVQNDSGSVDSGYAAAPDFKEKTENSSQEIHSVASASTSTTSSSVDADPRTIRRRLSILDKIPREVRPASFLAIKPHRQYPARCLTRVACSFLPSFVLSLTQASRVQV